MKALLLQRTGSLPVLHQGTPRASLSRHDSGSLSYGSPSPRISLHLDVPRRSDSGINGIRRTSSETNLIHSDDDDSGGISFSKATIGSMSMPAVIPEGGEETDDDVMMMNYAADWSRSGIPVEELVFPGGGDDGRGKIGAYYVEMLKSEPMNPLILRNYAKFLHEVEGDMVKAEEYYGRAILANPGDGEVLSLYGRLIWESKKDGARAKHYFDRAVDASPNDCTVMGSYAQFMWEAEEDDNEEDGIQSELNAPAAVAMLEAF